LTSHTHSGLPAQRRVSVKQRATSPLKEGLVPLIPTSLHANTKHQAQATTTPPVHIQAPSGLPATCRVSVKLRATCPPMKGFPLLPHTPTSITHTSTHQSRVSNTNQDKEGSQKNIKAPSRNILSQTNPNKDKEGSYKNIKAPSKQTLTRDNTQIDSKSANKNIKALSKQRLSTRHNHTTFKSCETLRLLIEPGATNQKKPS
jgi:hypothetical protein